MHEFVRDLLESYDTFLGSGGNGCVGLSGGKNQRLVVAQARLSDPAVLILSMWYFLF